MCRITRLQAHSKSRQSRRFRAGDTWLVVLGLGPASSDAAGGALAVIGKPALNSFLIIFEGRLRRPINDEPAARLTPVSRPPALGVAGMFDDDSFDFVLSWIMLHHTIEWETALAEAVRVTRPGGEVVGYDLLNTAPLRALHQAEGARFQMMGFSELRETVRHLPVSQSILTPALTRFAVRFTLCK